MGVRLHILSRLLRGRAAGRDAEREAQPRRRGTIATLLRFEHRDLLHGGSPTASSWQELNGDDVRALGAIGAFRVVPESDLWDPGHESPHGRDPDLRHLRDEGLVRSVSLDGHERAVTLTERGQHVLDSHRRDREDDREQAFHAGVNRPRKLSHDAQLYRAYLREEERLRGDGGDVRRVVLDHELKREYQEWLQEHNRRRADSDGRPDRDLREIKQWAREHELPYFDESVHFPDFASNTPSTDLSGTRTSRS